MLRRLQWRFIGITMGATLAVLLLLLGAIHLINYWNFRSSADAMLRLIAENDGRLPEYGQVAAGELRPEPGLSYTEETPFLTRFFVVRGDASHRVVAVEMEQIAEISEEDARAYYAEAAERGPGYGFCGTYRYYLTADGDGELAVFLNCERDLRSVYTFLGISASVAVVAYGLVFVAVYLLSKRIIRPMLRSLEKQRQFVTDAGHELKTPMTIISTSADVLDAELPGNEWVANIRCQAARLSDLIANLVTLSRMDEESLPVRPDAFVLSEAVWDVAAQFRAVAEARGKQLQLDIQDDVSFRGEAAAIQQMLSLLLDNAVKYADDGSVIRLRLRRERSVVLEISNACRLPPDVDTERLFDRFYRLDPARSRESGGSGIGLAVARAIAERHGGTLRAETDGRRICFTAVLP